MAERKATMTQSKQSAKKANVWTDEERAAMQESAKERKVAFTDRDRETLYSSD